jgi:hypothetical protein
LIFNEGCAITKKKEQAPININCKCPNPSCNRTFMKPLKAINVSLENPEPYLACPYCLIEITTQESQPATETNPTIKASGTMRTQPPTTTEKITPQSTPQCTHYYGYLSERQTKEEIPGECITCTQIVDCMLKTIKTRPDN